MMSPTPATTRFRFLIAALFGTLMMLVAEFFVVRLFEGRVERLWAAGVALTYALGLAVSAIRAFPCNGSNACNEDEGVDLSFLM